MITMATEAKCNYGACSKRAVRRITARHNTGYVTTEGGIELTYVTEEIHSLLAPNAVTFWGDFTREVLEDVKL